MNRSFDTPVETKPENRRYDNRNHQKQEKQYKDAELISISDLADGMKFQPSAIMK